MADNNNPIKYSDLINPDNSITDLIKQLDELGDAFMNTFKNIQSEAKRVRDSLQSVSGATNENRTIIRNASADADKLARAERDLAFAESDRAKRLAELKQAQREANEINKLTVRLNQSAEGSYNKLSAQYSLNKIYLNNMTAEERTATEAGRQLEKETAALYEEMKRLQEATGKHQLNVGNYGAATEKLTTIIRNNTQELARMRAAGEAGTLAYQQLLEETGELKGSLADATQEVNAMASNTTQLDAALSAAAIAGGGMALFTGAMELMGAESEGVAEAQKKLQATIAITSGLQALQNNLQKQSAIMLAISKVQTLALAKAEAYRRLIQIQGTQATVGATIAQKAFNLVAYANPYVLLALALVAVVAALVIFTRDTKTAEKEQERLNREMENANQLAEESARNAGTQLVAFKKLQNAWKAANGDLQKQKKIVKENKEEFNKLGFEVNNVKDAENLLITNAPAFVEAIKLKAKALAGQNLAVKEYERALEAQIKQEQKQVEINNKASEKPKVNFGDRVVSAFASAGNSPTMGGGGGNYISPQELAADRLKSETKELQTQYNDLGDTIKDAFASGDKYINQSADNLAKYDELVKQINVPVVTPKGAGGGSNDAQKAAEQRKKEILAAEQELKEARIANIQDETLRSIAETNNQTQKQVAAIKARVKDVKDLTQNELDTIAEIETTGRNRILQIQKDADEKTKRLQYESDIDELEQAQKQIELRLAIVKEGSEEEINLRVQLLNKQRQIELRQNANLPEKLRQNEADINAKYDAMILKETAELTQQRALLMFDQQQALEQSEFDLLRNSEERKTRFRLAAEKKRLQKILELNKTAGVKMTDEEVKTIENTIAKIDQEIDKSAGDERGKDIYGLFGLNLDDDQKEAISTSVSFAMEQLQSFLDYKVQAADAAVAAADKEVDATQRRLDSELEARANGYANNVSQAQKDLDLARKTQDKALKDQAKAQKAQQAIQTIQQIGNLVTASALIWSQLGFPWAIPAIAVMWGSFAAAKIKASQMTKSANGESESYGDGTVELLGGGSHQSGNDVDLGTKPDGTRRRAEGGEFFAVINKRNSRRFRKLIPDVIKSLNNGTFGQKYLNAFNGDGMAININSNSPELKGLSDDVREIKEQNKRRFYVAGDGRVIEIYKNLKRIHKN